MKNAQYGSNSQALQMKVAGLLSNKSLPRENEFDDAIIESQEEKEYKSLIM